MGHSTASAWQSVPSFINLLRRYILYSQLDASRHGKIGVLSHVAVTRFSEIVLVGQGSSSAAEYLPMADVAALMGSGCCEGSPVELCHDLED